jgi:hypothetical protein
MNIRKPFSLGLVFLGALIGGLLALGAPALALKAHVYSSSFGGAGSEPGKLERPFGVAVNEVTIGKVGDVYVVDRGNNRVEWFSPEGKELKGEFDGHETPAGSFLEPTAIAIDDSANPLDPSAGDVYVLDEGHNVVDKFDANGKYIDTIIPRKELTHPIHIHGVAVDPEGQLWISEGAEFAPYEGEVFNYSSAVTNELLSSRPVPTSVTEGLAVDSEDNLYVTRGDYGTMTKLSSSGEVLIENVEPPFQSEPAASFDTATGEIFIDNETNVAVFDSAPSCTGVNPCAVEPSSSLRDRFGSEHLENGKGIAVDSASDVVYVADSATDSVVVFTPVLVPTVVTGAVSNPGEGSATLNGSVDPEGVQVTSCEFEYGLTTAYESTAQCTSSPGDGSAPVAVSAQVSGLQPGATYHYRLVAANANGARGGGDATFQAGPTVSGESAPKVSTTEAAVTAEIGAGGQPTSYHVEYGPTAAYGSSTPQKSVGASIEATAVLVQLAKLQSGVIYHYRFVATNAFATVSGADMTFTTTTAVLSAQTLPDNRVYELVSPPEDTEVYPPPYSFAGSGPSLGSTGEYPALVSISYTEVDNTYRTAANGDAVAFVGESPASGVAGSGATGPGNGNQYLARRGTAGWETSDIAIPNGGGEGGSEFSSFSEDFSIFTLATEFPVAAEPEKPAGCGGNTVYAHYGSGYHALIATPAVAGQCFALASAGISANDAHILLFGSDALTAGAHEGEAFEDANLYDSVDGQLHQVNVLPDGEPEQHPHALFGGRVNFQENGEVDFEGVVSHDGTRVFWTAEEGEGTVSTQPKALYVRENDAQPQSPIAEGRCTVAADACTLQLDQAEAGAEGASGGGRFVAASGDGSRVFFIDCSRLTKDSTADNESYCGGNEEGHTFYGNDLYEYDFAKPEGERLTDLTVDHTADPLGADVQGVVGAAEDGSRVYFVANGVLTQGPNAEGGEPAAEQPNLYVSHDGATSFVATLSTIDDVEYGLNFHGSGKAVGGDWRLEPGIRTAEVAPGGNAMAFMSALPLTGQHEGGVFVYDAATGRLACASCSPSGAAPPPSTTGAYVPVSGSPSVMPRWLNETGGVQVYFMTDRSLVPQDANGQQDVYEWESEGSGGCTRSAGCVAPLSSVSTPHAGYLIDASANGEDVFFTQRASLVPRAANEDVKLYDARVNGGFPESSLACTGTGCQGAPPAPPVYATPASETFNGVGNYPPVARSTSKPKPKSLTRAEKLARSLKKCRTKPKRRRSACEKQMRKLYGPAQRKGTR